MHRSFPGKCSKTPAWAIFGSANLSNSIGKGHQRHGVSKAPLFLVGGVVAKFRDTHTPQKGLNFHQRTFWLAKTTRHFFLQRKYQQIQLVVKTHPLLPWSLETATFIGDSLRLHALPEKIIDPFGHRPWSPNPDFRPGLPTGHPTANQFRRVKGPTEVGRSRVRRRSFVNFFKVGSPNDFQGEKEIFKNIFLTKQML